jgi:hypothetical protein
MGFCGYLPGGLNCVIALLRHARLRSCDVWKRLKDSSASTWERLGTLGSASLTVTAIFLGSESLDPPGASLQGSTPLVHANQSQHQITFRRIAAHNPPLTPQIITPSNHPGPFDSSSRRRSFFLLAIGGFPAIILYPRVVK